MPKSESSVIHFFLRLLCRGGQGRRSEEEKKGLAFVSLCRKAPLSLPAFAFSPLAGTKVLCSDVPEAETDRGPRERRVTPPEKREGEKEAAREGSHARATKPPRSHWLERAKFCSGTARLALSSPRFPRGHVSHMNLFPLHRLNTNNRAVRRSFFFFFFLGSDAANRRRSLFRPTLLILETAFFPRERHAPPSPRRRRLLDRFHGPLETVRDETRDGQKRFETKKEALRCRGMTAQLLSFLSLLSQPRIDHSLFL